MILYGCRTNDKQKKIELADLNIFLETDIKIDSLFVSNISQDREFQFIPYSDSLNINFKDSINDLYNLWFYANGKKYSGPSEQVWLNGSNVVIRGKFKNKLEIDTVLGSDLYYKSMDFRKEHKKLLVNKSDDVKINEFLLQELQKNIDNPFSIEIANQFFYRNQSNKHELIKIYEILKNQNSNIKNHVFSNYKKIENILNINKVNFSKFQFFNIENELTSIDISENKFYLIDFWFINCPPCIKDHKIISDKLDFLETNNIELIGISIDRNQTEWKNFLEKNKYRWINYREVDLDEKKLTENMLITAFPTYLLLDNEGTILYRTNSFSDVEKELNK
jgi:thiol-disulfide isomerase/thioredoxin